METTMSKPVWYVASEVELIYKSKVKPSQRPRITSSKNCFEVIKQSWDGNKIGFIEQFKVLFLDRGNKVLGVYEVSTGGITGTVADPRLIFAAAIKANAVGMILVHNHPSGYLKPSKADVDLTQKIRHAGLLLDIQVLDHMIISDEGYFSFADEGLL